MCGYGLRPYGPALILVEYSRIYPTIFRGLYPYIYISTLVLYFLSQISAINSVVITKYGLRAESRNIKLEFLHRIGAS